jgi:hypothetical protein
MIDLLIDQIQSAYECRDWDTYQSLLDELQQLTGQES